MREGSYQLPDGRKVQYTDTDTYREVLDLYQYIEHDYKGSISIDAKRLEEIIRGLQAGRPLQGAEWDILGDLKKRLGPEFERWQANGRDGQDPMVPEGSGRIQEALASLSLSSLSAIREAYATPSTTKKDKATTGPHLMDSVLHDLAHTRQHIKRILDPDVKTSPESVAFNVEHALKHAESAQNHADKLDKHSRNNPSDPKIWAAERDYLQSAREAQALMSPNALAQLRENKQVEPHRHTISVDFDQTLRQGPHGMPGVVEGSVMPGGADALKALHGEYRVVICTARNDFDAVWAWLKKNNLDQYVDEVTNVKPQATAYIDDRAIHFTNWPDALKALDPKVQSNIKLVSKPVPVHEAATKMPPNLRTAIGDTSVRCGTCTMFDHGQCTGYGNWPVQPNWVCDSYDPATIDNYDPVILSQLAMIRGNGV